MQAFLFNVLADDSELAAKKSLAVLGELWRRHIWRDARTVNCIGEALSSSLLCLGGWLQAYS